MLDVIQKTNYIALELTTLLNGKYMEIMPLSKFIDEHFRDPDDFANIHGITRNSVYRLNTAGVHASGNRTKYTLWYPKKGGSEQQSLFN